MTYILGINAYHGDSAACLVKDNELIVAVEEERFRRIKHWAGFPTLAIKYCLDYANISLKDIKHVAINRNSKANFQVKVKYLLQHRPNLNLIFNKLNFDSKADSVKNKLETSCKTQFEGQIHYIEHHIAHMASTYFVSPFDEAVVVSIDGMGDFASAAWGFGQKNDMRVVGKVYFPHSLGVFYQALTQYLGFLNYGDEYKVMGLAPYGKPLFIEKMRKIVLLSRDGTYKLDLQYFTHYKDSLVHEFSEGAPSAKQLFSSQLEELLGCARHKDEPLEQHHKDIARSTQAMYEEAFFYFLNHIHKKYPFADLALAGGTAMNSVANGKIRQNTPFKRVYIQAAAGDAGGALGAAYAVISKLPSVNKKHFSMNHAYWGTQYSNDYIETLLQKEHQRLSTEGCSPEKINDNEVLCQRTAQAISDGKVIGWLQGRMEWGPRALGNRSILCDPRRANIRDTLNLKIKRRESFRPFAPSILREYVSDWFELDDDVPFMMKVFNILEDKRSQIPAVTHVDGTGRLQTVHEETNPLYYQLIRTFHELTEIPILLNTSFNENEPIVCSPDEALGTFLRTRMDVLVMGNFLVQRQ